MITYKHTPEGTYSTLRYLWTQRSYDAFLSDLGKRDYISKYWQAEEHAMIMGMPMVAMTFTWGPWP